MKLKLYQVDAFAGELFSGNPAAVCPLDKWLGDDLMQKIAQENNLSETAFLVKKGKVYEIRWFTPDLEVALCGHATLASAFVLFEYEGERDNRISFFSPRSGELSVSKEESGMLTLDFPADRVEAQPAFKELNHALGMEPTETYKGKTDYLLVYGSQEDIESLDPNFHLLSSVEARGVIVTARGNEVDFVSRFFAPQSGVNEDPVTGSAHTTLTPYWSEKLGKNTLDARQLSSRGGALKCTMAGERVMISGKVVPYLTGEINI